MAVKTIKAAGCPLIKYDAIEGTDQFSSGTKDVVTTFSTIHGALATCKGAAETIYWSSSGGTVTFTSENGSSAAYFTFRIWGE